tara:strand:+ start:5604 stop:6161 length:558 start_codon:yes stop_codon:yes gene_type:complete
MKKARITKITEKKEFAGLHVFELTLHSENEVDDGVIGNIYKQTATPGVEVNQEIEYTINDKGTIKIQTEYEKRKLAENTTSSTAFGYVKSNTMTKEDWTAKDKLKSDSIARQTALKAAVAFTQSYIASGTKLAPKDITNIAGEFMRFITDEIIPEKSTAEIIKDYKVDVKKAKSIIEKNEEKLPF